MARIIDITDRLSFGERPRVKIKEVEIEINTDAPTVLKIMSVMNDDGDPLKMYQLLFDKENKTRLEQMKLSFKDFMKVIEISMNLATGEDIQGEELPGEQ